MTAPAAGGITPRDEYFHERNDDPDWNESGWFSFMVPERRLSGMVYCYHRPNMGYSTGGFAAWDPTGDRYDNCLWYDLEQISPLAPAAEMFERDPLADRLRATDDLGRELVAEGRATNMMIWPCYPTVYAWFTHFEWEFDGRQASGEEQEWVPINQRRRFVRRRRHG